MGSSTRSTPTAWSTPQQLRSDVTGAVPSAAAWPQRSYSLLTKITRELFVCLQVNLADRWSRAMQRSIEVCSSDWRHQNLICCIICCKPRQIALHCLRVARCARLPKARRAIWTASRPARQRIVTDWAQVISLVEMAMHVLQSCIVIWTA
jgi:hypothetical protein